MGATAGRIIHVAPACNPSNPTLNFPCFRMRAWSNIKFYRRTHNPLICWDYSSCTSEIGPCLCWRSEIERRMRRRLASASTTTANASHAACRMPFLQDVRTLQETGEPRWHAFAASVRRRPVAFENGMAAPLRPQTGPPATCQNAGCEEQDMLPALAPVQAWHSVVEQCQSTPTCHYRAG